MGQEHEPDQIVQNPFLVSIYTQRANCMLMFQIAL